MFELMPPFAAVAFSPSWQQDLIPNKSVAKTGT